MTGKLSKDERELLERIVRGGGRLMTQQLSDENFELAKKLAKAGYVATGRHPTVLDSTRKQGVETLVATEAGRAALRP